MSYGVGTLAKARGRVWVVLPGFSEALLKLRPPGGAQAEESGILTSRERVEPASVGLPDAAKVGDCCFCRLRYHPDVKAKDILKKLRVGDYRIVCKIEGADTLILGICHRKEAYKRMELYGQ